MGYTTPGHPSPLKNSGKQPFTLRGVIVELQDKLHPESAPGYSERALEEDIVTHRSLLSSASELSNSTRQAPELLQKSGAEMADIRVAKYHSGLGDIVIL